jgi:protein phosphatase
MWKLHASGQTDVGRRRSHNEDAFLCDESLGLFVVADGLGGHAAGEVASQEAIDVIHAWVRRERSVLAELAARVDESTLGEARRMLERALKAATYHVHALAEFDARRAGMGTTVSALAIAGRAAAFAQVGDSRIYRVRDRQAVQLTDDHTLVAMQIRDGLLSPEQARHVPFRNMITRAVGSHDYVEVDTGALGVQAGDAFLLCTDGLHGYLPLEEVPTWLALPPAQASAQLIALANARGGKDNITAVAIRLEP